MKSECVALLRSPPATLYVTHVRYPRLYLFVDMLAMTLCDLEQEANGVLDDCWKRSLLHV